MMLRLLVLLVALLPTLLLADEPSSSAVAFLASAGLVKQPTAAAKGKGKGKGKKGKGKGKGKRRKGKGKGKKAPAPAPAPSAPMAAPMAAPGPMAAPAVGPTDPPPTAEPTMSPSRFRNYVPIKSTWEVQAAEEGPTPTPPRDCVRAPGRGMCTCRDIIAATASETYACEVKLQALEVNAPDIARENWLTKFDHPLFNTFAQLNSTRRLAASWRARLPDDVDLDGDEPPQSRRECQKCMLRIAEQMPHPKMPNEATSPVLEPLSNGEQPDPEGGTDDGEVNFLQKFLRSGRSKALQPYSYDAPPKYEPEEFGWRIFDESPDWSAVLRGMCTAQEIIDMEEGLTYFWSCDNNRKILDDWSRKMKGETVWVDAHPGKRLGIY